MSPSKSGRPLIIIRKKVSGEEAAHGGSWKVAYADFVTAMMALFLLLWLLLALAPQQKKALSSVFRGEKPVWVPTEQGAAVLPRMMEEGVKVGPQEKQQMLLALGIKELITRHPGMKGQSGISSDSTGVLLHIDAPVMFEPNSVQLTKEARLVLEGIEDIMLKYNVGLVVRGHADAKENPAPFKSLWELSTARAATCITFLADRNRVPMNRLTASGFGASRPLVPDNSPDHAKVNPRVEFYYFSPDIQPW